MPESLTDRLAFDLERAGAVTATTVQAATFAAARLLAEPAHGTMLAVPGRDDVDDGYGGLFAWDADSTTADNNDTILQITGVTTGRWRKINVTPTLDIRSYGGVGDGQTNVASAWAAAMTDLAAAGGGVLYLPEGTYVSQSSLSLSASNITIDGDGPSQTIIQAGAQCTGPLIRSDATNAYDDVTIQNLTLDANNNAQYVGYIDGTKLPTVTLKTAQITPGTFGGGSGYGFTLLSMQRATISDVLFTGEGTARGHGLYIAEGAGEIQVSDSTFRGLYNGISATSTGALSGYDEQSIEHLDIQRCHFDGQWYILPSRASSTGTYAATTLTNASGAFTSLSPAIAAGDTVRVMVSNCTGTATFTGTAVIDGSATFTGESIKAGEIVRTSGKFGVITGVEDDTHLRIEGWLDATTLEPTSAPTNNTTYTVYTVYLGKVASLTSTVITVVRWHDMDGTSVTPANGSTYEILPNHPNYTGINVYKSCRRLRVTDCRVIRSWSDGISFFGKYAQICRNQISWGQDYGITCAASAADGWNLISENLTHKNGTVGICAASHDNIISNNTCIADVWVSGTATNEAGILVTGNRNLVIGNVVDGQSAPQAANGIYVSTGTDNLLIANRARQTSAAGIRLVDASTTGTKLRDNEGTVVHSSSAPGGTYMLDGSGDPESNVTAGPASIYQRTSNGYIYRKSSGTAATNWSPLVSETWEGVLNFGSASVPAGGYLNFPNDGNLIKIKLHGSGSLRFLAIDVSDNVLVSGVGAVGTGTYIDGRTVYLRGNSSERIAVNATGIGFNAATPIAKPTISGTRDGNAALASVLTQLANYGLITDSTTAGTAGASTAFASLYRNAETATILAAGGFENLTDWTGQNFAPVDCTNNVASGTITITTAGKYEITYAIDVTLDATHAVGARIARDGSGALGSDSRISSLTAGVVGRLSRQVLLDCTAGTVVSVQFDTTAGTVVTSSYGAFTVARVA